MGFPLQEIQNKIAAIQGLDGWLLYDFRGTNSLALRLLQAKAGEMLTRRFFYWIPKTGTPVKIVNDIEKDTLNHLPGDTLSYGSWKSLEEHISHLLAHKKKIAMEYVPNGRIPVISKLDAGTFEWLVCQGVEIVSSWPIAQYFVARLTPRQQKLHIETAKMLVEAYRSCWDVVKRGPTTEYDLQQHILSLFEKNGYETDHPPIVAVGKNSALPHYIPTKTRSQAVVEGELLLIDLWAKKREADAPFADLCQVAFVGKRAPKELEELYSIVLEAQTAAFSFLKKKIENGETVQGCQVDDVARSVITQKGYDKYFLHRTGHNIHTDLHGFGPNLDNFETNDTRPLLPSTCYSIEPGIYLPNRYGIRLECNVIISEDQTVSLHGQSPNTLPCISS